MIRDHLRSNVVGYVALFVALSGGTALAADTVFSEDIVNGQVKTNDISNSNGVRSADVRDDTEEDGGLAAVDLAPDSVGGSELISGSVGTFEIGANEVLSRNIAPSEVNAIDLANDAVSSSEIQDGAVDRLEIDTDAVGVPEIATDAVGGAEIGPDVVGPPELSSIHEHRGGVFFSDETAHDGIWAIGTGTVACGANEDLLSASIDWGNGGADVGHGEKALANVVIERVGTDSATVSGAFDGGGGEDELASFEPVATCIGGGSARQHRIHNPGAG
jgi:hypothetical protein